MNRVQLHFTMLLALALTLILFGACKPQTKNEGFIVLFTSPDSQLIRAGQKSTLKRGQLVQKNDSIQTGAGIVDLQSLHGSLVRIQAYSHVQLTSVGSTQRLNLEQGAMVAKIERQSAEETFEVSNPTLIAGVRGTTFKVSDKGVKVLDGKVAVKPRLKALEKADEAAESPDKESLDPALAELARQADASEQVLEAGQEAVSEPAVKTVQQGPKSRSMTGASKVVTIADPNGIPRIKVARSSTDVRDLAEAETLVGVEPAILNDLAESQLPGGSAAAASNHNNPIPEELTEVLVKSYDEQRDVALDKLERDTLGKIEIKDDADIRKHYEIVESLHLHAGGAAIVGAVVAQAGDILVVHTPNGVKRLHVSDVNYIDYQ
ncbi:MAG: FecR domain-containing protein [Leptospiraceae bacterium]|nr:FecR domain-containing protein [Leptospiraceae bacterium]